MKRILLLMTMFLAIVACKNSEECQPVEVDPADLATFNGEFIYMADAAVLKGDQFIYGVALDCMTEKLAKQVEPVKGDEFDMVPVVIKGVIKPKEEGTEGWDEFITITEIVSVSDAPAPADIKFEETQE